MEPKTKEEMDVILAYNRLIGEWMRIEPEIEYCVGDGEGYIYNPRNIGNLFSWPNYQKTECERWLAAHPNQVKQGYKTIRKEWWPWYNQDWNKLMEVIKAIINIVRESYNREKDTVPPGVTWQTQTDSMSYGIFVYLGRCDIQKTYAEIVRFINWHNATKQ